MSDTQAAEHWMGLALAQAREAALRDEVPVGAVLVKNGQLIASAHNAPISSRDPCAHAEILVLRAAAHSLGNYRLDGCELYVTLEPCPMCAGAMLHARLDRVVFGAPDPKTGSAGSVINVFDVPALNHQTRVRGGVLAQASAALLQDFFRVRRTNAMPVRQDALRTPASRFEDLPLPLELSRYTYELPSLDGLRLHWFDGRRASPQVPRSSHQVPSIALHGADDWSLRYLPELCAGEPWIAVDLPGFGLSDKPKKQSVHTIAWHAQVLAEWMDGPELCLDPSGQPLAVVAPYQMHALVSELKRRSRTQFTLSWDSRPSLSASAAMAPYPDKGHMAGPRALSTLLDN